MSEIYTHLSEILPDPVYRADLTRLSSGILNSKSLANKDSRGFGGIKDPLLIGNRIAYTKENVLAYLESITSLRPQKPGKLNKGTPTEGEQEGGCHDQ
jgi:hypothetical protein